MRNIMIAATMTTLLLGCKKDEPDQGTAAGKARSGGETDKAAPLPALTAEAPLDNITTTETPPFESIAFRMTGERDEGGWPTYDAYNLNSRPVKYLAIQLYGYDQGGAQIAYTSTPLSWNGNLTPGGKSDWPISVGLFETKKIPASAVSFDVCYSSIKFEGDEDSIHDFDRCPASKPRAAR